MIHFEDLVYAFKKAFGLNRGGRNFPVYPDDRFLVSYPRSGNTWTRFLIANLLFPEQEVSFLNIDHLIPDIININRRTLARIPRPRLIKSHEYFDPRYKKVIYIVRDPRDIVISYYFFHLKQGFIKDDSSLAEFTTRFVSGEVDPIFASWGEHVTSWLATRFDPPNFLLLRYEEMKANTVQELMRVARFLGADHSEARLGKAIQESSAKRMRELEKRDENLWIGTRKKRKDVRFVRSATSGEWRTLLSKADIEKVEHAWGPLMKSLGYELVSNSKEKVPSAIGVSREE